MKQSLFILSLFITLQACASLPSPYITHCEQPACEAQAKKKSLPQKANVGTKVVINADFSFVTDKAIEMLAHQDDILIIAFPGDDKIAAATLSLQQFGLENTKLTAETLMDMAFLETFEDLENLSRAELHTIRAIKLEALKNGSAVVYTKANLAIYFYSHNDSEHKAYIMGDQDSDSWVMLDFYDITMEEAKNLLSTLTAF